MHVYLQVGKEWLAMPHHLVSQCHQSLNASHQSKGCREYRNTARTQHHTFAAAARETVDQTLLYQTPRTSVRTAVKLLRLGHLGRSLPKEGLGLLHDTSLTPHSPCTACMSSTSPHDTRRKQGTKGRGLRRETKEGSTDMHSSTSLASI